MPILYMILIVLVEAAFPHAQQDTTPERIEYEDADLRVVRISLAPHASSSLRPHSDRVVIFTTAESGVGAPTQPPMWQEAATSAVVNSGTAPRDAVVVEFKGQGSDAATLAGVRNNVRITDEMVINNRRAVVRWVRVPPGAPVNPGCHTHPKPTVYVHLADADVAGVAGGDAPVKVRAGQVTVLRPGEPHHFFRAVGERTANFVIAVSQENPSRPRPDCGR